MRDRHIRCCLWFRFQRYGTDGIAGFEFLQPFDDHMLAGLQSLRDDPLGADAFADGDRPGVHFVVRGDDSHLIAALQFGHSPLGDQQGALTDCDGGPDTRKLARSHDVPGVGEKGCDENRAGFHIHLPVGEKKLPLMRIDFRRC